MSLRIWAHVGHIPFDGDFLRGQIGWFVVLSGTWLILANVNDFYDLHVTSRRNMMLNRLLSVTVQMLIVYLLLFFVASRDALPRLFILYHAVISSVLIGFWRSWHPFLIGWSAGRRRALIVGTGWAAETILTTLENEAPNDYEIAGLVGEIANTTAQVGERIGNSSLLGTGSDLPGLVRDYQISELILTYSSELPADIFEGLMTCYEQGVAMTPMPILYEQITGRVPIEHIGRQHWAVVLPLEGQSLALRAYLFAKRVMDVLLALIGLVVFALMLPFLALIMTLELAGSDLFRARAARTRR